MLVYIRLTASRQATVSGASTKHKRLRLAVKRHRLTEIRRAREWLRQPAVGTTRLRFVLVFIRACIRAGTRTGIWLLNARKAVQKQIRDQDCARWLTGWKSATRQRKNSGCNQLGLE